MAVADAFAGWLVLRGDVAEAQELADRLIADAGDADTLAAASAFERTVKRPDRAVALAERASKLGLRRGPARAAAGRGGAGARRTRRARSPRYLGVDKRDPSFFEARLRAAELLREQGKLDEAERALERRGARWCRRRTHRRRWRSAASSWRSRSARSTRSAATPPARRAGSTRRWARTATRTATRA